jgi:hypothetical protein
LQRAQQHEQELQIMNSNDSILGLYRERPIAEQAKWAGEMADELSEKSMRAHALAMTICDDLAPPSEGSDSPHHKAWLLAQVLTELLEDCEQDLRLRACLKNISEQAAGQAAS